MKKRYKLKDRYKNMLLLLVIYSVLIGCLLLYIKRIESITNEDPGSLNIGEIFKK